MNGERVYRGAVLSFSIAFLLLGIAVLAITLANGGGPASTGFLMGVAFLAVGAGRLWLGRRSGA
jgi:VIT1/CCC1 family predicted Fe2+/Mn2+ transporter